MKQTNPVHKNSQDPSALTVNLLQKLAMTNDNEFGCDEAHLLVDQFAEMKLRGDDVESLMPMVKHHLDMCRDCFEEYDALIAALEFEKTM